MDYKVPFSRPSIGEEEIEAANRVMRSGWLAAGPETEKFETEFSDYIAAQGIDYPYYPYCIFTNSCTSALKMAYKWAKEHGTMAIKHPVNTYSATYSAADEMGLLHSTYDSFSPLQFPTEARVNVHYGGVKDETPCLIEDSAHRIEPQDYLVGKIRCYSFYPTKNMTAGGGGMIVTLDKEIYERLRLYWKDGLSTSSAERARGVYTYEVKAYAGGYDFNDIGAAIGRVQLRRLPEFNKRREEIVAQYNKELALKWNGNHLYPYHDKDYQDLLSFLHQEGVQASVHYPGTGWDAVSLPLYPDMTDEQVNYVIQKVKEWQQLSNGKRLSKSSTQTT